MRWLSLRLLVVASIGCASFALLRGQVRQDVFIHVGTVDSLDATVFVPEKPPPVHGYPAILFIHGFGASKNSSLPSCEGAARNGFVSLAYTVRGHGLSTGLTAIMSGQERNDLPAVLRYLRALPNVDTNAVGITGGSQGGLHALWAVVDRLPVRVACTDDIIPRWASDLFSNGCIRRTLLVLLHSPGVRYSPERDVYWNLARADAYDSLKAKFVRGRDLDTSQLSAVTVPIQAFMEWQDHYFSPAGGIAAFVNEWGPKQLYVGTQGHFSDEVPGEFRYQAGLVFRWFRKYLTPERADTGAVPPVSYAYSSLPVDSAGNFTWTHETAPAWPPFDSVRSLRYYVQGDSSLSTRVPSARRGSFVLRNEYRDTSYTFDTAFVEGFRGARFNSILPQHTRTYDSPVLTEDLLWFGAPEMRLWVRSSHPVFPIHAQIYEVDSAGAKYFINRINYTARHWKPGSRGWIAVTGIPHAHRFTRGSRIRIEITNIDRTNRKEIGTFPFVVPVLMNTDVTVYTDRRHPASIDLPVVRMPILPGPGN